MIRIRIIEPCTTAKLNLAPGDEIHVTKMTPELQALVDGRRIDESAVAEIVRGTQRETATTRARTNETATA